MAFFNFIRLHCKNTAYNTYAYKIRVSLLFLLLAKLLVNCRLLAVTFLETQKFHAGFDVGGSVPALRIIQGSP